MKAKAKRRRPGDALGPFPPLASTPPGRWMKAGVGDEAATSGGGRRTVLTEVMVAPNRRGWIVRTLVASTGSEAVALCFVPGR